MSGLLIKSDLGTLAGGIPESDPILDLIKSVAAGDLGFLLIQRADDEQVYIQTYLEVDGLCLEHRAGGPNAHFESRGRAIEQVHRAMMSWARGTSEWGNAVSWSRLAH